MPEIEMLCMANSKKLGERCVAGLLQDGTWVRPVTAKSGGALTPEQCLLDIGRPIRPLDVVRLKVREQRPQPHQPENWLISAHTWQFVRKEKKKGITELLSACESSRDLLFGTDEDKVSLIQINEKGIEESLVLVRVTRPEFYRKRFANNVPQIRVDFTYAGIEYDLSVTFESPKSLGAAKSHKRSSRDWWFTISLGEPFQPYGSQERYCYKLVAGAMKIP